MNINMVQIIIIMTLSKAVVLLTHGVKSLQSSLCCLFFESIIITLNNAPLY